MPVDQSQLQCAQPEYGCWEDGTPYSPEEMAVVHDNMAPLDDDATDIGEDEEFVDPRQAHGMEAATAAALCIASVWRVRALLAARKIADRLQRGHDVAMVCALCGMAELPWQRFRRCRRCHVTRYTAFQNKGFANIFVEKVEVELFVRH